MTIFLCYRQLKATLSALNMKLRTLNLSLDQFVDLLQGKSSILTGNLPSDFEILDSKVDLFTKQISFIVRSDSFEDIPESYPTPELQLTSNSETKPLPRLNITVNAEAKPQISPAVAKSLQPPPSRYASKMENEFSPEQRKLLSFTVKDDCVVVKPITFLKTEWDDINDVVKSLGGKWVKGDIISYWEIPL